MRLIDADCLLDVVQYRLPITDSISQAIYDCVEITRKQIKNAPTIEAEPVKRGKWKKRRVGNDGYEHHYCTNCKTDAIFHYQYYADFDEGIDGEMEYIGMNDCDIEEYLTERCPKCGSLMDLEG